MPSFLPPLSVAPLLSELKRGITSPKKGQAKQRRHSEDFSLLVAFLLVTFRGFFVAFLWLFRGPLLSRNTVSGLFRDFFVASVLGKIYAYSPWNSLLSREEQSVRSKGARLSPYGAVIHYPVVFLVRLGPLGRSA